MKNNKICWALVMILGFFMIASTASGVAFIDKIAQDIGQDAGDGFIEQTDEAKMDPIDERPDIIFDEVGGEIDSSIGYEPPDIDDGDSEEDVKKYYVDDPIIDANVPSGGFADDTYRFSVCGT